ncbi:MAG: glycosyltransferase family 2 protein [Candidatus Nanohaloarchaeota archaeon QJJ-5]|nr:glycosyltransferase family 2 protein [Candidatus Nanohaloarchaeota archaeon QJJ-5]
MFVYVAWLVIGVSLFGALFWLNVMYKEADDIDAYPEPSRFPSLSVLLPAYNEEDTIREAIESILDQNYPDDKIQIVVINDGSTDATEEIASEYEDEITLLSQKNQGKGAALNTGLETAEGEIVVVQDADSVIQPDAYRMMVGHFDEEEVGGVIAGIKPLKTNTMVKKLQKMEYLLGILYRKLMSVIDTLYVTPGALSMYRRDLIEDLGQFDEDNLTEDLEIALRVRKHNYTVRMSAPAITRTEFPATLKELMHQRIRWYRGLFNNTMKYREMMFDRSYGLLGMFQMPVNILFPVVAMIGALLVMYGIGKSVFDFGVWLSAVGTNIYNPFGNFELYRAFMGLQVQIYFPLIVGILLVGLLLYMAHWYNDESFDNPLSLALFFIAYYTVIGVFWIMALIKELTGREHRW